MTVAPVMTLSRALRARAADRGTAGMDRRLLRSAAAELDRTREAPAMLQALRDLLEWAEHTGGWEAPVWTRARKLVRQVERPRTTVGQRVAS